ncbi:MAG: universal stress protein [Planctomycetes bacterium]|nr:universal stress protein [Planctomycetota bacterium]
MAGFTSILHPTDFSEASRLACAKAVELARQCGAKLTILHAYANPLAVEGLWQLPDPRPELEDAMSLVAADEAAVQIERVLRVGAPAEAIVEFAKRHNCDLIVMGTHGRSGLQHLLVGSVAEKVIRLAPCPVMVVRERPAEQKQPPERAENRSTRDVIIV